MTTGVHPPGESGAENHLWAAIEAAFDRSAPQGSHVWNFGVAMTRLAHLLGLRSSEHAVVAPDVSPEVLTGKFERHLAYRLKPWIQDATLAAAEVARATQGHVDDALAQVLEALRFLAARVQALESQSQAVEESAPSRNPPELGVWAPLIVEWLGRSQVHGPVVVDECLDAKAAATLASSVIAIVRDGESAWEAAAEGLDVRLQEPLEALCEVKDAAAIVLSGFVDSLSVPETLDLVSQAWGALCPAGGIAILATTPSAAETALGPVAFDLAPGRPLHAETWEHLLVKAGFTDVGRRADPRTDRAVPAWMIVGRKPRVDQP